MDTIHDVLPHLSGTGYGVFCLNVDESDSNKAMASQFGVSGYPNTLILGTSGRVLYHVKGYMESSKLGELSRKVIEHHKRS
jgi:thioredoxin-related protein